MPLPHATRGEMTNALRRDPYRAIGREAAKVGADMFLGRLMLRETLFLTGQAGAELFYSKATTRKDAAPTFLKATLFGHGGVQGLTGEAHDARKAGFLRILGGDGPEAIAGEVRAGLDALAAKRPDRIAVQPAMAEILTRAICRWAGIDLDAAETPKRARQLSAMFEYAAPVEPGFVRALIARSRANGWAAGRIGAARSDGPAWRGTPVYDIAGWRDGAGDLLERDVAGVELLNVLRPTVAISVYLSHMAHALATQENAERAMTEHPAAFVQEVRRFYPFFPMVAARIAEETEVEGTRLEAGTQVVLDIYGVNHDARVWSDPMMFRPARFMNRQMAPMAMIPQGGGDEMGHRCAGEAVTRAVMETFADWLRGVRYDRPMQDLDIEMGRPPALPADRVIWNSLRPI